MRVPRPLSALVAFAVIGCGSTPPPPPGVAAAPEQPTLVVPQDPPKPVSKLAEQPVPAVVPPSDLGGKAVEAVLQNPAALPNDLPTAKGPKPRASDLDRGEWPAPKGLVTVPSTPALPKAKPNLPSPPPERGAPDVAPNLTAVTMKERPPVKADGPRNPLAVDVPMMAWPRPDRASLDDPTVDASAARVIVTPFPLPTDPLPFLKLTIPDPFEFKEQLKGKVGRDAEFATTPVVVNPERK